MGDEGATTIGTPLVDGARVAATVLDQTRADKILVFKKKRRKNYRRMHGHRQDITVLRITDIAAGGKKRRASRSKAKEAPSGLLLPAQGLITVGYGETDHIGAKSQGVYIAARQNAIIVTPSSGTVKYAGEEIMKISG